MLTSSFDLRFFDRFIPIFPVMHRPTFVYRDCSHQLLLNAIAIGSLYLGPSDSIAKGEVLWRLAHTAVATSWQTLIAHRSEYDACPGVQLILSSVLSVTYGALSKNTAIRAASQALHSSAFFWARQCGIFDSQPYNLAGLPSFSATHSEKYVYALIVRLRRQEILIGHGPSSGCPITPMNQMLHFKTTLTDVHLLRLAEYTSGEYGSLEKFNREHCYHTTSSMV